MQQSDWLEQPAQQLSSGFPGRLALVDLETTGGSCSYHQIIEIGVITIDDGQIVTRWQRFINPERPIPDNIQNLTGITNQDTENAPLFAEVAPELEGLLKDRVLVAHNAKFDFGFLKAAFKACGIRYKPKVLCSVKLSRLLFPQFKRHSLNHIIQRFQFSIANRHRALDDAQVIWQLFLKISEIHSDSDINGSCEALLSEPNLPVQITEAKIKKLPKQPGVYYFYDANGKLLYIGKSVNIYNRVRSHFSQDYERQRQFNMYSSIAEIDYTITPSDFGAQLLESQQIKELQPEYNRRLRRIRYLYFFATHNDENGYQRVSIERIDSNLAGNENHFGLFRSIKQAEKQLEKLSEQFFLCYKLTGLEKNTRKNGPCFRRQLKKCFGACCAEEAPELYNERLKSAIRKYQIMQWPWQDAVLIKEAFSDSPDHARFHLVDQWRYLGEIKDEQDMLDLGYQSEQISLARDRSDADEQAEISYSDTFDMDIYFILVRFLLNPELMKVRGIQVLPLRKIDF